VHLQDVIERQRAVPPQRLPIRSTISRTTALTTLILSTSRRPALPQPDIRYGGRPDPAVEHTLRAFEGPRHRGLDQQALGDALCCSSCSSTASADVRRALPDAGLAVPNAALNEKTERAGRLANSFRRVDDIGFGFRAPSARQQLGETGLALDLFERSNRRALFQAGGKLPARGGKQIGLFDAPEAARRSGFVLTVSITLAR